jgi:hypothetical protein
LLESHSACVGLAVTVYDEDFHYKFWSLILL